MQVVTPCSGRGNRMSADARKQKLAIRTLTNFEIKRCCVCTCGYSEHWRSTRAALHRNLTPLLQSSGAQGLRQLHEACQLILNCLAQIPWIACSDTPLAVFRVTRRMFMLADVEEWVR